MGLARHRARLPRPPAGESPRQGFFEHPEYLAVRAHLPAPWQDILDLAYYSGWRKNEILAADWRLVAALARRDPNSLLVFHRNGIAIRRWRTACRPASSTIAAAPPPATRRPQTSGATPRGLNPGFSESIGNSRRTGSTASAFSPPRRDRRRAPPPRWSSTTRPPGTSACRSPPCSPPRPARYRLHDNS